MVDAVDVRQWLLLWHSCMSSCPWLVHWQEGQVRPWYPQGHCAAPQERQHVLVPLLCHLRPLLGSAVCTPCSAQHGHPLCSGALAWQAHMAASGLHCIRIALD